MSDLKTKFKHSAEMSTSGLPMIMISDPDSAPILMSDKGRQSYIDGLDIKHLVEGEDYIFVDSCEECGENTSFGSGRFANRILGQVSHICAECSDSMRSCKGCEDTEDIGDNELCGYCAADCANGLRCEDSGELTSKGEQHYSR
tara:strand:- start:186 stop:617 length:432 start_codon:yes stop_codon:yes gene_type:complete